MDSTHVEPGTWRRAYDARVAKVHAHPLYPVLFMRVARAEASSVRGRFSSWTHKYAFNYWLHNQISRLDRHVPITGPYITEAPYEIARRMLPDVFPEDDRWSAEGDMLAMIYVVARDDVRNRIDGRKRR